MPDLIEIQPGRISRGLYNDILSGILIGDYPPKSTLPTESRLAHDYGVSRTVVREALELLKRQGLVLSRQGSGTVVADSAPDPTVRLNELVPRSEFRDCYAVRLVIEPEIAGLVAQSLSSEAREFLLEERKSLSGAPADASDNFANDARFHIRLAEYSGNVFFASIMKSLRPYVLFSMNVTKLMGNQALRRHIQLSGSEHLTVIEAILARDHGAARDAMHLHIDNGAKRIFGPHPDNPG